MALHKPIRRTPDEERDDIKTSACELALEMLAHLQGDDLLWRFNGPGWRLDALLTKVSGDASVAGQGVSHQARLEAALAELDTVVVDTTIRDLAWYWHADQANRHCGLALTAMRGER